MSCSGYYSYCSLCFIIDGVLAGRALVINGPNDSYYVFAIDPLTLKSTFGIIFCIFLYIRMVSYFWMIAFFLNIFSSDSDLSISVACTSTFGGDLLPIPFLIILSNLTCLNYGIFLYYYRLIKLLLPFNPFA